MTNYKEIDILMNSLISFIEFNNLECIFINEANPTLLFVQLHSILSQYITVNNCHNSKYQLVVLPPSSHSTELFINIPQRNSMPLPMCTHIDPDR